VLWRVVGWRSRAAIALLHPTSANLAGASPVQFLGERRKLAIAPLTSTRLPGVRLPPAAVADRWERDLFNMPHPSATTAIAKTPDAWHAAVPCPILDKAVFRFAIERTTQA